MGMPVIDGIGAVADLFKVGIEKIWPSLDEKAKAEVLVLKNQVESQVALLDAQNRAAIAEASSSDPYTSRARPSFLYVVYTLILAGVPMGFIAAFQPDVATDVAAGFKAWLGAIPDIMWTTFETLFVVYSGGRSAEKITALIKRK